MATPNRAAVCNGGAHHFLVIATKPRNGEFGMASHSRRGEIYDYEL